jgi:hypothetical protein
MVFDFLNVEHFTGNGARLVIFAAVKTIASEYGTQMARIRQINADLIRSYQYNPCHPCSITQNKNTWQPRQTILKAPIILMWMNC